MKLLFQINARQNVLALDLFRYLLDDQSTRTQTSESLSRRIQQDNLGFSLASLPELTNPKALDQFINCMPTSMDLQARSQQPFAINDVGRSPRYDTMMSLACQAGKTQLIQWLLDKGARLDPFKDQTESGLAVALSNQQWDTVAYLLQIMPKPMLRLFQTSTGSTNASGTHRINAEDLLGHISSQDCESKFAFYLEKAPMWIQLLFIKHGWFDQSSPEAICQQVLSMPEATKRLILGDDMLNHTDSPAIQANSRALFSPPRATVLPQRLSQGYLSLFASFDLIEKRRRDLPALPDDIKHTIVDHTMGCDSKLVQETLGFFKPLASSLRAQALPSA